MSIEKSHILVETDGKTIMPQRYIFIQAEQESYEIVVDASLGDMLNSIFLLWEAIKNEAKELSEQDLYELCEDFDLEYDVFRRQVRDE